MKNKIKKWMHDFQINLIPAIYRSRFFKNIDTLNWSTIKNKNIENELLLLKYLLDKDSIFIDVGANLGQYLFMTRKLLPSSKIHAFEPHPMLNKRLEKLFKGISIHPFALSSINQKSKFKIPFFDEKEIHTRGTLKTDYIDVSETNYKLIDVNVVTLDSIAPKLNISNISMIKIDVEGSEMDVVYGMHDIISKQSPILLIEIEQRHHQESILSFISKIEATGIYRCYYFNTLEQQLKDDIHKQDILKIQSLDNHAKNRLFINNFIFLPKEKFDDERIKNINLRIKNND